MVEFSDRYSAWYRWIRPSQFPEQTRSLKRFFFLNFFNLTLWLITSMSRSALGNPRHVNFAVGGGMCGLDFFKSPILWAGTFCISNIKRVVKKGSCVEPNLIFEAAPLPPRYDMIRRKTHLGCHLCPVENDPVPWEESIWSEAGNLSRRWGPWGPKFHPKNDNCYKIHQDTTIKMQKPLDINQRMIVDVCFALRELLFGNLS